MSKEQIIYGQLVFFGLFHVLLNAFAVLHVAATAATATAAAAAFA